MIPERRGYYFRSSSYHPEVRKVETKDDGDVKIKVRFDDGTTENREYNLEYLKRYVDYIVNPEDWILGEYNFGSIYFNRTYIKRKYTTKEGITTSA